MSSVNIVAWNVRGMSLASKRSAIFHAMKDIQPAILCLSETHLTADKTHLAHKAWMGCEFHSYSTHARGVSILVHKAIPFHAQETYIDDDGRFICIDCCIFQFRIILVAVYVPPPYSAEIMKMIITFTSKFPVVPILIIGDFNTYLNGLLDKFHNGSGTYTAAPTSLARLIGEIDLCDIWRTKYPDRCQYSCYSVSHSSLSRIDLAIGSLSLVSLTKEIVYLPRSLSDHSPLMITLGGGEALVCS